LAACALCGEAGPHAAFAVPAGGSVCAHCRPPGASRPRPDTVALMAALAGSDWARAAAADPAARREASGLVAALLQWHLEKAMRSLPLVDRGQPRPPARSADPPHPGGESAADPPATVPPRTPRPGDHR
ncbi:MAG TPA: DNA repair protein RecO C-terminal domain-containing protein, partial [Pilimelia sp.]|nr:DNA repair protein RecO C-terminal domain-containing protein [Pilimelia sp.]